MSNLQVGDYTVSGETLWRVYDDGQRPRLWCVVDMLDKINPASQTGKCLIAAGVIQPAKRLVAVGDERGITAVDPVLAAPDGETAL